MARDRKLFFLGGVQVEILGLDIERFFNIAAQRGLVVHTVATGKNGAVTFWTTPSDFKNMKQVARKADVKLRIRSKSGLPFFLYKNRKRKLLAAGAVFFFLILYGMSFFIWDISFEGNLKFTDEMILDHMETIPVTYGMRKSQISCEDLEAEIRNHFTEITWVSAEIKGTRLYIHVKENEALLAPVESDESPCDLAAKKAGTIVRTVVRSGFCQVKAGDVVEEGTLLVDGTIPIYDDSEVLVNTHEIHADAEIYAETTYEVRKTVPLTTVLKTRTGNIRHGVFFQLFDREFYFLMPADAETSWEFVMEQDQLKIFEDFYLPIYIGKITAYEYVPYEKNYTEMEIKSICDSYLLDYAEKLSEKGIQILGSDGKIEQGESGWQIEGTMTVIEDIASEVPSVMENTEES